MAYTPHNWVCNETITDEKMNHIERGIADAGGSEPFFITRTEDKFTYRNDPETDDFSTYYYLSATLDEVMEAVRSGRVVYFEDTVTEEVTMITYFHSDGITEGAVYTKSRVIEDNYGDPPLFDDRPDAPSDILTAE